MLNKRKNKIVVFLLTLIMIFSIMNISFASTSEYFNRDYWEWHTRTTWDDMAYNGEHIVIEDGKIDFYGYGVISYKDFLYKDYKEAGEKTFKFQLDESKANYHTLDGAGFIFNAKKENGKLTGDVLVITENSLIVYRLENVDIDEFEVTENRFLSHYASSTLASINKPAVAVHQFVIKTSPTNVTVTDNEEEILNLDLDYTTHAGEGFGLLCSYNQHSCRQLSQIEFSEFEFEIKDYIVPIYKTDKDGNPLQGAVFEILDENNKVIETGTTDSEGIAEIKGIKPGTYKVREKTAPSGYKLNTAELEFVVTADGKILDTKSEKEIKLLFENEKIVVAKTPQTDTVSYPKDTSISNNSLPNAGKGIIVTLSITIITLLGVYGFIRYKKILK